MKSVRCVHRQPTAPSVPLSATVSQPSSLHSCAISSQNLHWSDASHGLAPVRIWPNTSRPEGCPTQFRSVSPADSTGRAISSGSSNEVTFDPFEKTEKETTGPARLSEALRAPPCTSVKEVHITTVTGPLSSDCRERLAGSRMLALPAPLVSYVSCPETLDCTVMLSSGEITRAELATLPEKLKSAPTTTSMLSRITRPASTALTGSACA
mmetsp:Transcript_1746/g.5755  ORF Transcript_1746/g.5755 Transcript_1746/m.5755 type:complete len:210 (+) Transcript_1746:2736-3365(+)